MFRRCLQTAGKKLLCTSLEPLSACQSQVDDLRIEERERGFAAAQGQEALLLDSDQERPRGRIIDSVQRVAAAGVNIGHVEFGSRMTLDGREKNFVALIHGRPPL